MNSKDKLQKNKSKAHNYRFTVGRFIQVVVALVFLVFVGRLIFIGVSDYVSGENLAERTNQKYRQNIVLKAKRGTIYDRSGQAIAEDSHVYSLYAVLDKSYIDAKEKPLYVVDKKKTAQELSTIIDLDEATILKYLSPKTKAYQVEFGNAGQGLSLQTKQKIEKLKLPGIYFTENSARLYPNGDFASNIVGLAQIEKTKKTGSDQLVGTMGIEKYFDNVLAGSDGLKEAKVDSYGYELPNDQKVLKPAKNGDDVYLTIDTRLQTYMEDLLNESVSKYAPKGLTAVLAEAKTGKILAAAQRPSFNPQTKVGLEKSWRNRLVEDSFEPGSVMKILSLAATINSGNYNPNELYQSGAVNVMGSTIRDWNYSGWGSIPFLQAFPRSSNVGLVKLEQKMGGKIWGQYLSKFGITKKTGVTLPGETAGSMQFKSVLDQAVTSFGQGVNVTVMQMLQAFSAIANKGQMIKPQFVEKVMSQSGKKISGFKTKKVGKPVITAETANLVIENMRQVVNAEYGTGMTYKMEGVDLAVKTGTAQLANPAGGGYLTGANNYIFSVAGMAPASNPKYILYITVQQPQKMSQPAEIIMAEMFKPLMKRALELDNANAVKTVATQALVPNTTNMKPTDASSATSKVGLVPVVIGSGTKVLKQSQPANVKLNAGEKLLIYTGGVIKMPDMIGWTSTEVTAFTNLTGIKITQTGKGHVSSQSLPEKTILTTASQISVQLKE